MVGAYGFGTWNLRLTGVAGVARSVEGGLAGGVLAIEMLKARAGIRGSTGLRLAAPLAAGIAVGRIGCFLSGREDFTYGTATALPWGVDFGDGVRRHPVQLYEAAVMVLFLGAFLILLRRRSPLVTRNAFYFFIGPFNVFHLLSVLLLTYAILYPCAPHARTYFSARRRQCARRA
jgi:prolipoprotein diacylglyceryltransferase